MSEKKFCVNGKTIEAPGDVFKGDSFISEKTFNGDPTAYDKGSVYDGDGFISVKKYTNGSINPKSRDKYSGNGFVAVKQGRGKPNAEKRPKAAKNLKVFLPDGNKTKIDLPKEKNKLIYLKNQLLADKLIANLENAIFTQKDDDGDMVELPNDHTLYSWDKVHVIFRQSLNCYVH
uniref:Uncharacterized protein n=1 Tax=Strigamia maritima TaxID=126957 RepID=T1INL2_STRMM